MRIIGIDPGYGRLGVAVLESTDHREKLIFSGCLSTDASKPFTIRLLKLGNAFQDWCKKYYPNVLAIEKLFFSVNRKTALQVAEVRGLILYLAAQNRLAVLELAPQEVKAMITGYGQADKKQIAVMVQRVLKIKTGRRKIYDDEFDAVAIALAGFLKRRAVIHTSRQF
jgi:crossover junction endodeoxyribonuclease RuvC